MVDMQAVMAALATVKDPEIHRDLVSLNMVKNVRVEDSKVSLTVELTTPACPLRESIDRDVRAALAQVPGVKEVDIQMSANVRSAGVTLPDNLIPGIKNTVAVASGKGGVGKSTVSVNLAVALAMTGARVGLLDADIYGPNVPLMMGVNEQPQVTEDSKIHPIESYGVKIMSMGFLLKEDQPVIWRGPMLHGVLKQFLGDVLWGDLDYLVVDLPPGTGDVQLTLSQSIPLTCTVIVTTPQDVSLLDARKCMAMFKQFKVPIFGIIENMSYYVCPDCGRRDEIFSHGGGARAAERLGLPFLGEIPLATPVRVGGDTGAPIVLAKSPTPASEAFKEVAGRLAATISVRAFK
ncbi:MAG: iron-sulfur cluster carrier protein ApbC [Deltaproteobacteria bacterium]|nr:iron-sulfur cluster carrier protein ApbC [Deltaproteobacteria bacterium]